MQLEPIYHVLTDVKKIILNQNTLSLCRFMTTMECTLRRGQGPTKSTPVVDFTNRDARPK
jgi:hypothetical protein